MQYLFLEHNVIIANTTITQPNIVDIDIKGLYRINNRPIKLKELMITGRFDDKSAKINRDSIVEFYITSQGSANNLAGFGYDVAIVQQMDFGATTPTKENRSCLGNSRDRWRGEILLYDDIQLVYYVEENAAAAVVDVFMF